MPAWARATRVQGALANLNHRVGRGTIANVLKRNGWSSKLLQIGDTVTVEGSRAKDGSNPPT